MTKVLILFPNQIYSYKFLAKYLKEFDYSKIYLYHHPSFYGQREELQFNFNKKKIVYHVACFEYYSKYLIDYGISNIISYDAPFTKKITEVHCFDPLDYYIENSMNLFYTSKDIEFKIIDDDPRFLLSHDQLEIIYNKFKGKRLLHKNFYNEVVKLCNLPKLSSKDTENRNFIPQTVNELQPTYLRSVDSEFKEKIFSRINFIGDGNKYVRSSPGEIPTINIYNTDFFENECIDSGIKFVDKYFYENMGNTESFFLPVSFNASQMFMEQFFKERFDNFAKYQDSIIPSEPFLYHSLLSSVLNVGLLTPLQVIDKTLGEFSKRKTKTNNNLVNNIEAFIRQIAGWREYQRYIYKFHYSEIKSSNYFGHSRKLTDDWYYGTTGIDPLDDCIKKGFNTGYLHHIERLMVVSNFMNLCRIHPDEVYKWFMEFSTDSYDWVMIGNVYSMGLYADGGITMRKPYISSSNYIIKMSGKRYTKSDKWCEIWDQLYHLFLIDFGSELRKTRCCPIIRITKSMKQKIIENSRLFLKNITIND